MAMEDVNSAYWSLRDSPKELDSTCQFSHALSRQEVGLDSTTYIQEVFSGKSNEKFPADHGGQTDALMISPVNAVQHEARAVRQFNSERP